MKKGTLIRIFRTDKGEFLQELRRGTEKAEILSLNFNFSSTFIVCSSDRSTIHIFSLSTSLDKLDFDLNKKDSQEFKKEEIAKNQRSFLSVFKKILPLPKYFSSEWSFAQFRIPDQRSICVFGSNNSIIAISSVGTYYQGSFDTKTGGECIKIQEIKLSQISNLKEV